MAWVLINDWKLLLDLFRALLIGKVIITKILLRIAITKADKSQEDTIVRNNHELVLGPWFETIVLLIFFIFKLVWFIYSFAVIIFFFPHGLVDVCNHMFDTFSSFYHSNITMMSLQNQCALYFSTTQFYFAMSKTWVHYICFFYFFYFFFFFFFPPKLTIYFLKGEREK